MKVTVRFFAGPREAIGKAEVEQELPEGASVQALMDRLNQEYPELDAFRLKFAVNGKYVPPGTELHDGDQVACIPPVGGG
jgi:MoaD family protein